MDAATVFFAFLWWLLGGKSTAPSSPAPSSPSSPALPPASPYNTGTKPWPQVVPSGLPPFPGSGWEYDEPPPKAVQQRAGQLVDPLWKQGQGTYKIEQTEGRWLAYRAEIVRSGKKGVVAYRMKSAAKPAPAQRPAPAKPQSTAQRPAPAPSAPAPAPAPSAPAPAPAAAPVMTSTSPGWNVQVGPATSPLALPDLKYGDGLKPQPANPNVALVQQKLGVSPVDGRFGADTRLAVIHFQKQTGLCPADISDAVAIKRGFGAVKQATWTKLFAVRA